MSFQLFFLQACWKTFVDRFLFLLHFRSSGTTQARVGNLKSLAFQIEMSNLSSPIT